MQFQQDRTSDRRIRAFKSAKNDCATGVHGQCIADWFRQVWTGVDTPLAAHFNTHTHMMRVSVLQGASADVLRRRILERQWIQRLRNHGSFVVINRDDGIDVATL